MCFTLFVTLLNSLVLFLLIVQVVEEHNNILGFKKDVSERLIRLERTQAETEKFLDDIGRDRLRKGIYRAFGTLAPEEL